MTVIRACRTGAWLCVLCAAIAVRADAGESFVSTVALTDQPAAGVPGAVFGMFDSPSISRNGSIVFSARLADDGVDLGSSIWTSTGGVLRLHLREGGLLYHGSDSAPISSVSRAVLNDAGDVLVQVGLGDTGGWSIATPFEVSPGVLAGASIAAEGFAIPGFWSGDPLSGLYPPMLNQAGDVAFMGHRQQGIWSTRSGEMILLRKTGDHAWGSNQGQFMRFERPTQSASGSVAFRALVTNPTGQRPTRTGVWTNEPDRRRRIVIEDMAVGGSGFSNVFYRDFSAEPRINDTGKVAFFCRIKGAVNASNDTGICSEHNGSLRIVVREGQAAVGTDSFFTRFNPEIAFNAMGQIAFVGTIDSEPFRNSGVFRAAANGTVELVARENLRLPGTTGNVRFKMFAPPIMNADGQVVFVTQLFGSDVTPADNQALVFADSSLNLRTILRTGDVIEFGTGGSDARVIELIDLGGMEPGDAPSPLAEDGAVVFRLVFTDGSSGIFVSSVSCPADIATRGIAQGDPGYDVPDGVVSYADLNLFMFWWTDNDSRADVTTSQTHEGDPGFGVADGVVDQDDMDYFISFWISKCQ